MSKKKFSAKGLRKSVEFEYEFKDGDVKSFTYFQPIKKHVDEAMKIGDSDIKKQITFVTKILKECIEGERVDDLIHEANEINIMEFKQELDVELGKQKLRG